MPSTEVRTHISCPPEEVHAFLQDFSRYPEWIPFTKEVLSVDGDGGPGTTYRERGTGGTSRWEIVELQPGRREVHTGDIGVARVRVEMDMTPAGNGTDYRHAISYTMKIPVLGWLLDRLVLRRSMRKGTRETVANLQRILEAPATAK